MHVSLLPLSLRLVWVPDVELGFERGKEDTWLPTPNCLDSAWYHSDEIFLDSRVEYGTQPCHFEIFLY